MPGQFKKAGARLWASIADEYDLEEHEAALLTEACRTVDQLEDLAAVVAVEGVVVDSKAHPALVESRQLRLTLARLLASLRLPDEADARPQRRGSVRRPYNYGGSDAA